MGNTKYHVHLNQAILAPPHCSLSEASDRVAFHVGDRQAPKEEDVTSLRHRSKRITGSKNLKGTSHMPFPVFNPNLVRDTVD